MNSIPMKVMVNFKTFAACVGVSFALAAAPAAGADIAHLSPIPSAADKKAFLDFLLKTWTFDRDPPTAQCAPVLEALRTEADIEFLEPDAVGEFERPQGVQDLDKECALDIGTTLQQDEGGKYKAPLSRAEMIEAYGEPSKATRNFTRYNIWLKDSPTMVAVHFAERLCDDAGDCGSFPYYDVLDLNRCRKEMIQMPTRYGHADSSTTGSVTGVLRIKDQLFILWAGVQESFEAMMRDQRLHNPFIQINKLPNDVEPFRYGKDFECLFVSPPTSTKDPRVQPPS